MAPPGGAPVNRAGFTLPLALLAILGLTALALAAFTLVLGELGDGRVEARVVADLAAAGQPPDPGEAEAWGWSPGGGYRVEVVPAGHGARARVRLLWHSDPRREALEWGEPGRVSRQVVGPLGVEELLAPWGAGEGGGGPLREPARPVPPDGAIPGEAGGPADGLRVWGDGVVWIPLGTGGGGGEPGGEGAPGGGGGAMGAGVLLAPGDLLVFGDGTLRGLVVAGGRLELQGSVEVRGGAVGTANLTRLDGARIEPDLPALEAGLEAVVPAGSHLVPGGAHLGWFVP
ncbi:MAG: hypothetical protein EA352_03760 [Gemmatimonadales bacterium]|nr:MAG: hypothetical protein EA352_03760 [Gemmatimonadales bacterium]